MLPPVHASAASHTSWLVRQITVVGRNASGGHAALVPGQSSAASQMPAADRHTVDARNVSDGQSALDPVQRSTASHTPAADRQIVAADSNLQIDEQQSPLTTFPSSHCSPVSITELPHVCALAGEAARTVRPTRAIDTASDLRPKAPLFCGVITLSTPASMMASSDPNTSARASVNENGHRNHLSRDHRRARATAPTTFGQWARVAARRLHEKPRRRAPAVRLHTAGALLQEGYATALDDRPPRSTWPMSAKTFRAAFGMFVPGPKTAFTPAASSMP